MVTTKICTTRMIPTTSNTITITRMIYMIHTTNTNIEICRINSTPTTITTPTIISMQLPPLTALSSSTGQDQQQSPPSAGYTLHRSHVTLQRAVLTLLTQ
jgi:hypothetical protein